MGGVSSAPTAALPPACHHTDFRAEVFEPPGGGSYHVRLVFDEQDSMRERSIARLHVVRPVLHEPNGNRIAGRT